LVRRRLWGRGKTTDFRAVPSKLTRIPTAITGPEKKYLVEVLKR